MSGSDRIANVEFESIRGLPKFELSIAGKNLMLLSGNGGGKSSVVDGLEFLLNGRLERYHGEGTGAQGLKDATKNVYAGLDPKVTATLKSSRETLKRSGEATPLVCSGSHAEDYRNAHDSTNAFILRRSQLLQFIGAKDAERYQQVVALLSLESLNLRQKAFNEAAKAAAEKLLLTLQNSQQLQSSITHAASGARIRSEADAVTSANTHLDRCGMTNVSSASDFPAVLKKLKAKRPASTSAKREELGKSKHRLERVEGIKELVASHASFEAAKKELEDLRSTVPAADLANVVFAGYDYILDHPEIEDCPTCEQKLPDGSEGLKARLEERRDEFALWEKKGKKVRRERDATRDEGKRLHDEIERCEPDLVAEDGITKGDLEKKLETCSKWVKEISDFEAESAAPIPALPTAYSELALLAANRLEATTTQFEQIATSDDKPIEVAIQHIDDLAELLPKLKKADTLEKRAERLKKKTVAVSNAFKAARERALNSMFKNVGATVLRFYQALHDHGTSVATAKAECKAVTLEPVGRARAGGLRLTVDFLGKAIADPRAYLSDGHIDSLGLCIFLACVKHFHPPGGLLVLDDVLTSIDADHRHQVATLLLTEFSEYQTIVTTHDEPWWTQFQSAVSAVGKGKQWTFRRFVNWTVEHGPETSAYEGSRAWVAENLTDPEFRELGGSLRLLLESFLKRCADKLGVKIAFHMSGNYTAADFVFGGISDKLTKALKKAGVSQAVIDRLLIGVFGTGDLINTLSHDKSERLTCTLAEVETFVDALDKLTAMCEQHKLLKGLS